METLLKPTLSEQPESYGDRVIRYAHEFLKINEDRLRSELLCYVGPSDDPLMGIRAVRAYIGDLLDREYAKNFTRPDDKDRNGLALAAVCLDRVIDRLDGFRVKVTYER